MELYLVHGSTYFEGCGYAESVYGIYTTKEQAEIARKSAAKQTYVEKVLKNPWVKDVTLTDVENSTCILKLSVNQTVNIELGLYVE